MGTSVYEGKKLAQGVDLFVHNKKKSSDGRTALIVNTNDASFTTNLDQKGSQYLLTSDNLLSQKVFLNGEELKMQGIKLPKVKGKKVKGGNFTMPPHSIAFIVFD